MKKSFFALLLITGATHCKAQTPVISVSSQVYNGETPGAYYKDTENVFSQFAGEWQFNNGFQFFKIKLQQKLMVYDTYNNFYEDIIVGEYLYTENDIIKVNTINLLTNNTLDPYEHNITGNIVLHKTSIPPCQDCETTEKRLYLSFGDPSTDDLSLSGKIELRRVDENEVQKLKMILRETGNVILEDGMMPEFTSFNLPWGTYILTRP